MFKKLINNLKFKFQTRNLKYSRNLIYVEDGFIQFNKCLSQSPTNIALDIKRLMSINNIYSDLPLKRLYVEYKDNYLIYDRNPMLLYCRIPLIIAADFADVQCQSIAYFADRFIPSIKEMNSLVEPIFRLPDHLSDLFEHLYEISSPYLSQNVREYFTKEIFMKLTVYNFLKDWKFFYKAIHNKMEYEERLGIYMAARANILEEMGDGDSKKTIHNVIERYLDNE